MEKSREETRAALLKGAKTHIDGGKPKKLLHVTAEDLAHALGEDAPVAKKTTPKETKD
jgi:hypothetical protein